jgi:hypothetical protein
MGDVYNWLKDVYPPSYAPTSPAFAPIDEDPFADAILGQATLCDTDENGNMYIDMPHAWRPPIEQPPDHVETRGIKNMRSRTIAT